MKFRNIAGGSLLVTLIAAWLLLEKIVLGAEKRKYYQEMDTARLSRDEAGPSTKTTA